MTIWIVRYSPCIRADPSGKDGEVLPCFRIAPKDDPKAWIAETNPDLPYEVQEHTAYLLAEFLSSILGI